MTRPADDLSPALPAAVTSAPGRDLPPAARRALAEAAERRRLADETAQSPAEVAGRGGADPVRYGDWEVKGLATDF